VSNKNKVAGASSSSFSGKWEQDAPTTLLPKLRFPEFRGDDGWKIVEVGDVFQVTRGEVLSMKLVQQEQTESNPYPVYSSQTKNNGLSGFYSDYIFADAITWTTDGANAGDVNYRSDKFYCTNVCGVLLSSNGSANTCVAALINNVARKYVSYVGNPKLMNGVMSKIPIPLPSLPEQQKIAECLSSVDELISAQARKVSALKTHKKGLMQQLFPRVAGASSSKASANREQDAPATVKTQPRLRFPEFQNAGEWEEKALAEIVEVASGQVDPTKPPYCDFPQIGSENIESNTGKLVNVKSAGDKGVISGNYAFDENDVLYSKIRPALNKVAAPAFKGICSADIYPIRPANGGIQRSYLLYLLLSPKFLEYAIRNSERGKIPKINRDGLLTYKSLIPSLAEQQRIADCLTSLDALISAETQKHEALKTHKKGLMQQLFPSPDAQQIST